MASENRAAAALARTYPGGTAAFIQAMNQRARELGMRDTRFVDPTGLDPDNVSTAVDLAMLVNAGYRYPLIREFTTQDSHRVEVDAKKRRYRTVAFRNSNGLVRSGQWDIGLSKTGYISEAGRCLVMQARIAAKPVIIVLLDSWGKFTRIGDANRIKQWIERLEDGMPTTRGKRASCSARRPPHQAPPRAGLFVCASGPDARRCESRNLALDQSPRRTRRTARRGSLCYHRRAR